MCRMHCSTVAVMAYDWAECREYQSRVQYSNDGAILVQHSTEYQVQYSESPPLLVQRLLVLTVVLVLLLLLLVVVVVVRHIRQY